MPADNVTTTGHRIIDDALLARCRAERDRATDPARVKQFTKMLDFMSSRVGMTLAEADAEIKAQLRQAEAEWQAANDKRGKTIAALTAAEAGYFSMDAPVAGSWSLRATGARPPETFAATASQVLEHHTSLHDRLVNPPMVISSLCRFFAEEYADKAGADALTRYMFWPYYVGGQRSRQNWEAKFLGALGRGLFTAPTYQVTEEMCDVAEAMYEQTAKVNGQLEASDLPSECGFLWLDKPFSRADAAGESYVTRAVTWSPQSLRHDGETRDGVRVTLWADLVPAVETVTVETENWVKAGRLLMVFTEIIPFGLDFGAVTDSGVPAPLHYCHAVWLLLGTEVAATERAAVPRQVRKRALRSIKQHEVRVVTLRRAIHHTGDRDGGHREIDWSCRWLVRGFWRHQWGHGTVGHPHQGQDNGNEHCLACGARITWVRPYVKGPDDRPLKATETLYRLSR